jgi:hypothetical protein
MEFEEKDGKLIITVEKEEAWGIVKAHEAEDMESMKVFGDRPELLSELFANLIDFGDPLTQKQREEIRKRQGW